jgi:hypothetical protein
MTVPLRPCLTCGLVTRTTGPRCGPCERKRQRRRNADPVRQALYGGPHKRRSLEARRRQPWCSICGKTEHLAWDHEHGQVECRECNGRHRRDAS